jgi:hypothetical protein
MIKNTIELLSLYDYYNVSKRVDVAKGFNEIPSNWKAAKQLIKRILWQRKLK